MQSHLDVTKITKMDVFFLFQSENSIFHDEETSFTPFSGNFKQVMKLQLSPKSKPQSSKQKRWRTNRQKTKLTGMQKSQNSKSLKILNFNAHTRTWTTHREKFNHELDHGIFNTISPTSSLGAYNWTYHIVLVMWLSPWWRVIHLYEWCGSSVSRSYT